MSLKLESLQDLLEIDTDKLKAADNKKLLTRVKQLVKGIKKEKAKEEENDGSHLPYEGVSVVGQKYVGLRFDLETKEARVTEIVQDSRPSRGQNYIIRAKADDKLMELATKQKEITND